MHASWVTSGTLLQGLPEGEVEEGQDGGWCLETVRKLGGHASLTQTLTLLREKAVVSLLKEMRFFFSITRSHHHNFPRGLQQTHPSFHPTCFPFVNLKVML